jgi:hypothetical protein
MRVKKVASIDENKDLRVREEFEDRTIFSVIEYLHLSIYFLYFLAIPFLSFLLAA